MRRFLLMQCVVDTGRPILVANVRKREDPTRAQSMPNMSMLGSFSYSEMAMTSFLMVPATRDLCDECKRMFVRCNCDSSLPSENSTSKFHNRTNAHGLDHGQGSGGHRGSERVCDIVGACTQKGMTVSDAHTT